MRFCTLCTMKVSCGILPYRVRDSNTEVLLLHPGGPFFKHKDEGSWTIPKGLSETDEEPLKAAKREFEEETGLSPTQSLIYLGETRLYSSKKLLAWAMKFDCDPNDVRSNSFEIEYPKNSGKMTTFPEVDCADWFSLYDAKIKIQPAQLVLLNQLACLI